MSQSQAFDPERLLAESRWLRGLAWQLVGDGDLADDVVQETWRATRRRCIGAVTFDAGNANRWSPDGARRLEHLPIGAFELRRRVGDAEHVSEWQVVGRGEIAAGQWRTLHLR